MGSQSQYENNPLSAYKKQHKLLHNSDKMNRIVLLARSLAALVTLVSDLHGVDAALSEGSSQRAGHQPLRNAQRLLVTSHQSLNLTDRNVYVMQQHSM